MRVLVVNKYWHTVGGVERHVEAVCQWLAEQGHTVIPFAMDSEKNRPTDYDEFFPSEVDMRSSHKREALQGIARAVISQDSRRKLRQLIAKHPVDVAYVVHVYHQLGTAILNELSDLNIPIVLSLHDYKVSCGNYRFFSERTNMVCTKCLNAPVRSLWAPIVERCWGGSASAGTALVAEGVMTRVRRSYQKAHVVTALNSLQERAIESAGVPRERIMRLPHPVTLGPDRVGYGSGVLYVGRLVPEKGISTLIQACARAGQAITIVGDGRERGRLVELARNCGADAHFLGELSATETASVMQQAAVLAVPSVWPEVSPLVVYEAMALDVPVMGSAMGGLVDQLADERGYLVEPGAPRAWVQAIEEIMRNPDEAQRRSRRAREHAAAHLTMDNWQSRLCEAFTLARERAGVSPR